MCPKRALDLLAVYYSRPGVPWRMCHSIRPHGQAIQGPRVQSGVERLRGGQLLCPYLGILAWVMAYFRRSFSNPLPWQGDHVNFYHNEVIRQPGAHRRGDRQRLRGPVHRVLTPAPV